MRYIMDITRPTQIMEDSRWVSLVGKYTNQTGTF